MANKNILMHPIVNGEEDVSTNLFPKTTKDNVIDFPTNVSSFDNDAQYTSQSWVESYVERRGQQIAYKEVFKINKQIVNGICDTPRTIEQGTEVSVTIIPNTGYELPSGISMTGADYIYDGGTGVIVIYNVIENINITCECTPIRYAITTNVTNGTYSGSTYVTIAQGATITISAGAGYVLPDDITVTGADGNYLYDSTTGAVSIGAQIGAVSISAECEAEQPSGLTDLQINDDFGKGTQIVVNDSMTPNEVRNIILEMYQRTGRGDDYVLAFINDGVQRNRLQIAPHVVSGTGKRLYNILIAPYYGPEAFGIKIFDEELGGWIQSAIVDHKITINGNYLNENDIIETMTCDDLWNGILFGKASS